MAKFIDVTTGRDSVPGSLREAIKIANSSGNNIVSIHIKPCFAGAISLTDGELSVSSNVVIVNESGRTISILAKKTNNRIFNIGSSVKTFKIEAPKKYPITLSDGKTSQNGGAIYIASPMCLLTLKNVIISGNATKGSGGGIYTLGSILLISSIVSLNEADQQGGGIWSSGQLTAIDSYIVKNKILLPSLSSGGGGVFTDNGNIILNRSHVSHNSVAYDLKLAKGGSGGGIIVMTGSTYVQNNSHVDENTAFNSGGIQQGVGNIYLTNKSTCSRNQSFNLEIAAGGGGVTISLGSVTLDNSHICDNITKGMYSGGIVTLVGDVLMSNHSTIMRNVNRGPGGGIAVNIGSVTVDTYSHVSENTGASLGGGIVCFTPSPAHVSIMNNSHVSKNTLTNEQTIRQTFDALLRVIERNVSGQASQAKLSGGAGGQKYLDAIPLILGQIIIINKKLKNLPINEIGVGENIAGGAIASLLDGQINIDHSYIDCNFSGKTTDVRNTPYNAFGGGIFGFAAAINCQHSRIADNKSLSSGGGLWVGTGINVSNSTIHKNKVIEKGNGGGIFNTNDNSCTLIDTTITENITNGDGGGIFSTIPFIEYNTKIVNNKPNNIALL